MENGAQSPVRTDGMLTSKTLKQSLVTLRAAVGPDMISLSRRLGTLHRMPSQSGPDPIAQRSAVRDSRDRSLPCSAGGSTVIVHNFLLLVIRGNTWKEGNGQEGPMALKAFTALHMHCMHACPGGGGGGGGVPFLEFLPTSRSRRLVVTRPVEL